MKNSLIQTIVIAIATLTAHSTFTENCSFHCGNVSIESPAYCIDTQFRALIFKPSASNLHYAAQAKPLPLESPNWNIYDIHPDYHFGFDLGIRALFHNRCTNLALNWVHFKSSDCARHIVPIETDMIGPFFEIGPDATPYKAARGTVHFDFNAVNLTYGQLVNFGDCLQTNIFVGINVTSLKECLSAIYTATTADTARTITTPMNFVGAGPQVGLDFAYHIIKGLNLTGRFAASIVAGPAKNHTVYSSVSPLLAEFDITPPNTQRTCVQNRTLVVPVLDERLGIAYFVPFCEHYMMKLEVGYEALIYISALQSVDMGSEVINIIPNADTVGVFARTFQRTLSNFALTGPYVAFDVAF